MNRNIDLYDLFDAVTEDYFFFKTAYRCACADPESTEEKRAEWRRGFEQAKQELERVSALMDFDAKKLIALHRLFFHWERVRRWARIFPMKDHYEAIVGYVAAEPPLREGAAV